MPISGAHCTGERSPLPRRETGRVPISGAHCTGEQSPLPLRERVRVRGWVTSLSDNTLSARLRRAGHEDSVLDGVSPPLRGLASDFSLRGQRKVTNRAASPTCSPSCVGFPRFPRLSHGTRRWALTFTIPGVGQSPLRTSLSLRQTGASVARPIPVWPLAQRRSLGVLPRGLDKRDHLGEQQGATSNPQPRGQMVALMQQVKST